MKQQKNKDTIPISVRVSEDYFQQIEQVASTRGKTRSEVILESIRFGLPKFERKNPAKFVLVEAENNL